MLRKVNEVNLTLCSSRRKCWITYNCFRLFTSPVIVVCNLRTTDFFFLLGKSSVCFSDISRDLHTHSSVNSSGISVIAVLSRQHVCQLEWILSELATRITISSKLRQILSSPLWNYEGGRGETTTEDLDLLDILFVCVFVKRRKTIQHTFLLHTWFCCWVLCVTQEDALRQTEKQSWSF